MEVERVKIFVDANNFQQNLNKLYTGKRLDYRRFFAKLQGNRKLEEIEYCVSVLDPNYDTDTFNKQDRWLKTLETIVPCFKVIREPMKKHLDENGKLVYTERCNDVTTGISIVSGAIGNSYDTGILIASDSDFLNAIHMAQASGKRIEYANFPSAKAYQLKTACDKRILLTDDYLSECWRIY